MSSFDPDPAFDAAFDRLASEMQRSEKQAAQQNARAVQIGGDHYKKFAIQPIDFIEANGLSYSVGNIIKYCVRYQSKNGVQDLRKARHYLDMLIERETANG
jgi:hypothetical protein